MSGAIRDEWEPWLVNALRDPEFAAAYAAAAKELDLAEQAKETDERG